MGYHEWKPYVPVAKRRDRAKKKIAKAMTTGEAIAPIPPFRGALAKNFWGQAWCENLERYSDYANRLPRGRTYVRNGSIIDLRIMPGRVTAQVMGSRLYRVEVAIKTLPQATWKTILADCAGSLGSLVDLLRGKLSKAVMERVARPNDGLFPSPHEIRLACSCPDWAGMCKHVAATLYGVGTRLDLQPEMLFILRDVDASELIDAAAAGMEAPAPTIEAGKRLSGDRLADVFGIELAAPAPTKRPAHRKTAARPSSPKTRVAKPAARTGPYRAAKPARKSTVKKGAKEGAARPRAPRKTASGRR